MSDFKLQRPAAYMELLQRFEEAKKSVSSLVRAPIVIRPPYAFIEHYLKYSDKDVRISQRRTPAYLPSVLNIVHLFEGVGRR